MKIEITQDEDTPKSWTVLKLYLDQHGPEMVRVIKGDVVVGEITAGHVETVVEMADRVRRAKILANVPRYIGELIRTIANSDMSRSRDVQLQWMKGLVDAVKGVAPPQRHLYQEVSYLDSVILEGYSLGKAIVDSYNAIREDQMKGGEA